MSEAGKKAKFRRLHNRAKREMLTPYEKMTPHDRKVFDEGTARLMRELKKGEGRG